MKKVLLCLIVAFSSPAFSGDSTGTVGRLYVHYHNASVLFRIEGSSVDYAPCATTSRYVIDTNSQQGQNTYSAILAAKAAGKTVFVKGENDCTINGSSETVRWIYIE